MKVTKEQFFAQYWGQEVLHCKGYALSFKVGKGYDFTDPNFYLLLRPLSSITDEEAMEIAESFCQIKGLIFKPEHSIFILHDHRFDSIIVDHTRSLGFALPYMGITVEEQIERGWIKLKEE